VRERQILELGHRPVSEYNPAMGNKSASQKSPRNATSRPLDELRKEARWLMAETGKSLERLKQHWAAFEAEQLADRERNQRVADEKPRSRKRK
jgi:hypothetical protein